jgi:hypothetical protein
MLWRAVDRVPWGLLLIEAVVVLLAVGAGWLVSNVS